MRVGGRRSTSIIRIWFRRVDEKIKFGETVRYRCRYSLDLFWGVLRPGSRCKVSGGDEGFLGGRTRMGKTREGQ
eukprot:2048101-Pyramimonas_sp.AAC.1